MTQSTRSARADWEARIGLRSDAEAGLELPLLAAPTSLRASPGRGQVTLDWEPVDGAAGYVIERAAAPDGPWDLLEIGEPEVRPVPHPPYTDTAGTPGNPAWYRVAAAASVKDFDQPRSDEVSATPTVDGDARVEITVRADAPNGPDASALAADHRLRAPQPARVDGDDRRATDRLGVRGCTAHGARAARRRGRAGPRDPE